MTHWVFIVGDRASGTSDDIKGVLQERGKWKWGFLASDKRNITPCK